MQLEDDKNIPSGFFKYIEYKSATKSVLKGGDMSIFIVLLAPMLSLGDVEYKGLFANKRKQSMFCVCRRNG